MSTLPPSRGAESSVDAARLWAHAERFARSPRLSGSLEEREAFDYAREVLEGAGFETRLLEHPGYVSLPGSAALRVGPLELECITHAMAAPAPDGVQGRLVDVGEGRPDAYRALDVEGAVVLVRGLASPAPVLEATRRGALGAVFVNAERTYEMIVSPVWGSPTPDTAARLPRIPVVSVDRRTSDAIHARLADDPGAVATLVTQVDTGWRTLPLLEARLTPPDANDDFVLFSGHIDAWHLGAMDNGGANATMLEVARQMAARRARLRRGLRLAFWSGHSHGRYAGSAWYADHHFEELTDHCLLHVNIDSVGGRGADELSQAPCMPEARALAARAIATVSDAPYQGGRFERAGDQSFWGTGTPSVFMGLSEQRPGEDVASRGFADLFGGGRSGGFGWWWHTTEDTLDKLDPQRLARDASVYLALLEEACTAPVTPLRYAATALEIESRLAVYAEAAADLVDWSSSRRRAAALVTAAGLLDAALDVLAAAGPDAPGSDAGSREADRALLELGRRLVPLNYVAGSIFDHDPALRQPPLPALAAALQAEGADDDERHRLATLLRRRLNGVEQALRQALTAAEAGSSRLEPFIP